MKINKHLGQCAEPSKHAVGSRCCVHTIYPQACDANLVTSVYIPWVGDVSVWMDVREKPKETFWPTQ